ncbi:MAG: cobalamin-dependent protein [Acidobacteriota bacterium]
MKITFIRPRMMPGIAGDALEPLGFGILAGLTPDEVELKLYDERIEAIDFTEDTDLVAISFDTYSAKRAYKITARYKQRGMQVVVGGYHPTLCTDEALEHTDAVIVGDAEDTWPRVVEDARKGKLQRVYRSQYPPLAKLRVDRSIFAGKRYGPLRLVQFGRHLAHAESFSRMTIYSRINQQRWNSCNELDR